MVRHRLARMDLSHPRMTSHPLRVWRQRKTRPLISFAQDFRVRCIDEPGNVAWRIGGLSNARQVEMVSMVAELRHFLGADVRKYALPFRQWGL